MVEDHLISHSSKKSSMKEMFDALVGLYESKTIRRKMVAMDKLWSM